MSEFIDIFVKFSNFMSRGEAFDSLFCPEGRVFVHNDCPRGRDFAPFKSCPGRGGGGVAMDEIDACIMNEYEKSYQKLAFVLDHDIKTFEGYIKLSGLRPASLICLLMF